MPGKPSARVWRAPAPSRQDMTMTLDPPAARGTRRGLVERLDAASEPAPTRRTRASEVELRVGIVLWPGFPLLSLAGLCDGLRHAADLGDQSRQRRCSWTIFGVPGTSVSASCGVGVPVESAFDDPEDCDYVAVIGGLLPRLDDVDGRYPAFLRRVAAAGVPLIGLCTGSFVLARHGLLEGHVPAIHPFHVEDWQALHPGKPFETDCHYAFGANRVTCAGGTSIVELVTELVRRHCGADRAAKVVHQMTVKATRTASHVATRHALGYESGDHDKLRRAVVLMEKNITTPLEIAVIARLVDSSSRQLERVFVAETGSSPSEYYRNARLKYARWLLTTTDLPIVTIAYESGFSDASHFIRHFQQLYGMAPGRLRKALQAPSSEP
jgi:transcriptional regulator GlxA family with amidase domain